MVFPIMCWIYFNVSFNIMKKNHIVLFQNNFEFFSEKKFSIFWEKKREISSHTITIVKEQAKLIGSLSNSSFQHFKKSTSIKQSSQWSDISISRVLQIVLVPGSRSVNYTIGAVRTLSPGRENSERVISRVKDGSSVVGRTSYFTDRYKITIPRFSFIPYI